MVMVVRSWVVPRSTVLGSEVGTVWYKASGAEVGSEVVSACAGVVLFVVVLMLAEEGGFFLAFLEGGASCEFPFCE